MLKGFVREGELRRWAPWIGAALFILAAAGLEIRLIDVCWDPKLSKAMKANEAASCFEFWLNRYQGLIAGILSLAAALIGAYLVWRQIAGMRDANDISRRAQAIAQYEAVTRRYLAIKQSVYLGQKIQKIAQIIDSVIELLRSNQPYENIDRANRDVVEAANDALRYSESLKADLSRGIDFPSQILQMEFDCDWAIKAAQNYRTIGPYGIVRNREDTERLYALTSHTMKSNSITFFQWKRAEEARLEDILRGLDKIIIS